MKKIYKIILAIVLIFILLLASLVVWYFLSIKKVSNNSEKLEFVVDNNATFLTLGSSLKEKHLIKSELAYKIYIKLNNPGNLKAGTYNLSENMGISKIVEILSAGNSYNPNNVLVTFKEGLNMRQIAKLIEEKTDNTYDSVFELLKDQSYLDELINNYWFITDDIKNSDIYYSLEGYLFPDTYEIDKTKPVKEIFKVMLNRMEQELDEYKSSIEKSNYSVHQILTLASLVEKEGKEKDFDNIASVFENRLNIGMALQSCASAYYGVKLEFNELGIATSEVVSPKNAYNTYNLTSLPVGPISNPGDSSIKAVLSHKNTDYLYFLSDNEGTSYFFKTYFEHQQKEQELIALGKWYR